MRAWAMSAGVPRRTASSHRAWTRARYAPRPIEGATVAYGMLALPTVGPPYLAGATTLPAAR